MDDFLALELNRRKDFLEKIVIEKTAALAQSGPEGRLRCVDRNGRPEYYWRKDGKDVTGTYIPVGRQEFAAALAQRNYDQAVDRNLYSGWQAGVCGGAGAEEL